MFSLVFVWGVTVQMGLCTGGALSRRVSIQRGLGPGGLCPGGLCPSLCLCLGGLCGGGSLPRVFVCLQVVSVQGCPLSRGVTVQGISVQREVSMQGISVQVFVQGVSVWVVSVQGISVHGSLCLGVSVQVVSVWGGQGDPSTVKKGRYAFYWNAFLL